MLRTPEILGMSMAPQTNRRLLVLAAYAILVACLMIILLAAPFLGGRSLWLWVLLLPLAHNVVSYRVFGKLVKPTILDQSGLEITRAGTASKQRDQEETDERDVAIRNAAHYRAFRIVVVYGLVLWLAMPIVWSLGRSNVILFVLLLAVPLLTMLLTLPQAIVLWTEPDVPEEARV